MVKKPTVTIGITAFNEEKALPLLLADIEKFDKTSLKLEKVIVYSDGSTDLTVNKAKKSAIKNLDVINMKKRQGKKAGINYILKKNKSDFLVLFDADIRIYDRNIISKLLNAFKKDKKIVLVGGNTQPLNPTSFFQRGVYSTFKVFEASRDFVKDGNNIFGCNGACMVLKADFAKRIQLPNIVNDDDYLYFSVLSQHFKFKHVKEAVVFYKLPTNATDYIKQCFRSNPEAVSENLVDYFGDLIKKEYKRPFHLYGLAITKSFVSYPLETVYISLINILIKPFTSIVASNYKLSWHRAGSTK